MRTNSIISIIILIMITMFAGCITPSSEASPSEIVETFASWYGDKLISNCYTLMSSEYKNTTDYQTFEKVAEQCTSGEWRHYEFVGVVESSEKFDGNNASLEILYLKKSDSELYNKLDSSSDNKRKIVNLVKEEGGWKITTFHYELKKM